MARSNEELAAELDVLSTTLSGPRRARLAAIAGELRGTTPAAPAPAPAVPVTPVVPKGSTGAPPA